MFESTYAKGLILVGLVAVAMLAGYVLGDIVRYRSELRLARRQDAELFRLDAERARRRQQQNGGAA